MNITFENILYIVVIILGFILGFYVVNVWLYLKKEHDIKKKVIGNSIALSKLKGELTKLHSSPEAVTGSMPDFSNMTLEEAAEMLGIEPKQLNNPLIRPLAEKIFANLKAKTQNPEQEDVNTGY